MPSVFFGVYFLGKGSSATVESAVATETLSSRSEELPELDELSDLAKIPRDFLPSVLRALSFLPDDFDESLPDSGCFLRR